MEALARKQLVSRADAQTTFLRGQTARRAANSHGMHGFSLEAERFSLEPGFKSLTLTN
jgi:hypothetical protein